MILLSKALCVFGILLVAFPSLSVITVTSEMSGGIPTGSPITSMEIGAVVVIIGGVLYLIGLTLLRSSGIKIFPLFLIVASVWYLPFALELLNITNESGEIAGFEPFHLVATLLLVVTAPFVLSIAGLIDIIRIVRN